MTTSSIHLLTGAYATDALDPPERRQFEAHLGECTDCLEELTGLVEAAGRLAVLSSIVPTPHLKAAVLAEIESVRPIPRVHIATQVQVEHRPPPSHSPWGRMVAFAAAAALALVTALTGVLAPWQEDDRPLSAAASIMHASDAQHSSINSEAGWAATVWHSDSLEQAVLVTENIPAPPRGTVYQLWLEQPSSGLVSAGLLPRVASQTVVLSGDASSADGAQVTIEPTGGSSRPTSEPIARFDFGQGLVGGSSRSLLGDDQRWTSADLLAVASRSTQTPFPCCSNL